jgi:hypothetical protein
MHDGLTAPGPDAFEWPAQLLPRGTPASTEGRIRGRGSVVAAVAMLALAGAATGFAVESGKVGTIAQ